MTEFLVFATLLVIASLIFVLLPLWRAAAPTTGKRREANITIYHQRYAEIEREVSAGRLTRRDAEIEKDELGARLLDDIDAAPGVVEQSRTARRPWLASLLIVVLLVGGSAAGYRYLGDPRALRADDMPDVASMIGKLEQRVAEQPDDLRARAMLARAQQTTGNYAAAAENYRALNAAMPEPRAPIVAAQAQATLQASDDLQGNTRKLYEQLLSIDEQSSEALWYLGLAAAARGEQSTAIDYWDRLLDQDLPDDFAEVVRNRRAELAGDKPALQRD